MHRLMMLLLLLLLVVVNRMRVKMMLMMRLVLMNLGSCNGRLLGWRGVMFYNRIMLRIWLRLTLVGQWGEG